VREFAMAARVKEQAPSRGRGLAGRTVYIPQMAYAGARLVAAVFRSYGIGANMDRDVESFLDLARAYQRRKKRLRVYPGYFA
jgi:hypothetical protein